MKKQNFKDRMHEHKAMEHHKPPAHHMHHSHHKHHDPQVEMMYQHPGSHKDQLKAEHMRHGERLYHESSMHHGLYRNEVDEPRVPQENYISPRDMGMDDFFDQADPIAHGQSTGVCALHDTRKIDAQFKDYHWD